MTKIEALANQASEQFKALILEAKDEIETAAIACSAEAQVSETEAKLRIGCVAAWSLDRGGVEYSLTFGVRHKLTANAVLEDPNQPTLTLNN